MFERLPSFTVWAKDASEPDLADGCRYLCDRILRPSLYPTHAFCTAKFRYSTRLPETFDEVMKSYAALALDCASDTPGQLGEIIAVQFAVIIQSKRPVLDARTMKVDDIKNSPDENIAEWFLIGDYPAYWDLRSLNTDSLNSVNTYTDAFASAFLTLNGVSAVGSLPPIKPKKARNPRNQ